MCVRFFIIFSLAAVACGFDCVRCALNGSEKKTTDDFDAQNKDDWKKNFGFFFFNLFFLLNQRGFNARVHEWIMSLVCYIWLYIYAVQWNKLVHAIFGRPTTRNQERAKRARKKRTHWKTHTSRQRRKMWITLRIQMQLFFVSIASRAHYHNEIQLLITQITFFIVLFTIFILPSSSVASNHLDSALRWTWCSLRN